METKELTCIGCPMGCLLTVTMDHGEVVSVSGNSCKIGDNYARKEVVRPMRIVTSSVPVKGKENARVSVKTASDIPKSAIFDVMRQIHHAQAVAPVKIGDVVIADVAGTGVNVIATKGYQEDSAESK